MDLFNESLIVPSNLRFFLHRLSDSAQPSTNILKINAMNTTSASSGSLVSVRLPMALVDLNSFAWFFQTTTTNGTFANGGVAQAILSKGSESLISRMEISVNGLGLLNLQSYNLLYDVLKSSHMDADKQVMRRVLQNEVDVAPILGSGQATPLGGCAGAHSIFVSGASWATQATGTTLAITCVCGALYPQLLSGANAGDIPYTALGITITGALTSSVVSAVRQVPAYAQSVSLNGTTSLITGDLVTQFTLTLTAATSIVTTGLSAQSFSVMIGGNYGTAMTPVVPPLTSLVSNLSSALVAGNTTTAPYVPAITATAPFYQANQCNYHCISDFLAFFKAQPSWLQLQMLGEVEIRFTLQDNTCMIVPPQVALATRPDYNINNMYFTIRTCSFDNNFYDDILSEKLSSGGEIEIPYNNYYNVNQVQSAGASSTRFSVNTQCLNKVISVNRPSYYNSTLGAMMQVPCGYGIKSDGNYGIINKGAFFQTYSANAPYNATLVDGVNYWQYQINNQFLPNVKIDPNYTYYNSLEAWNLHNSWSDATISGKNSIFQLSQYQMSVALDFMDASIPRLLSGVDTRGAVSVCYLLQDDNNQNDRTDVFLCFTSVLKVGANQQIQVVY